MVFVALIGTGAWGLMGYFLYTNYITYPPREIVNFEETGHHCLDVWTVQISNIESPFENSFLVDEIEYANGNQDKINFYKKMLSTIEYHPLKVNEKNVYGNDYIDSTNNAYIEVDSFVEVGEEVDMEVVDYDGFNFEDYKAKIEELMRVEGLELGMVDYENRLVNVFLDFMNWLPNDEIPTKLIRRAPNMVLEGGVYVMTEEEDIYLDKLLFSSNEFYEFLDRFSLVASGTDLKVTEEYEEWMDLDESERLTVSRPDQYNYKECISKVWCGTHYLTNDYVESHGGAPIVAEVGDGSIGNPYGLYTDAVTSLFISEYDSLGNIESYEQYPIRVELIEYGYSQDAIDFFEDKDVRNRGIDIKSDTQYCYMVFNVTNLSDITLTIKENMGLCDVNGNMQARTGVIYGLQGEVELAPDESGIIETWQSSTTLWKKYVVWGNDFQRRDDLIFFRLLAGDIENTDEFKGVTVNTSRDDKDVFKQEEDTVESEDIEELSETEDDIDINLEDIVLEDEVEE